MFGWLLVGAFCAAVSCGGGHNSSTPQGFGVPCTAAKDCSTYDLLCGDDKTCVECVGDATCDSGKACSVGLCKVQEECSDSRDCSGQQVCDEEAGVCVDCLTSVDCAEGQKCANNSCSNRPKCEFTSDCSGGLLCLIDPGVCVTCRNDDDCGTRRVCEDYECVLPKPVSTGGSSNGGSGGKSGTAGAGGKATAGTSSGGTPAGGSATAGTAGTAGAGGTAGSIGEGGAGGILDCGCSVGYECTPDLRCVAETVIDDLVDCDDQILSIAGRQGSWAADADVGIDFVDGFTDPGSSFGDRTCAAWLIGAEQTVGNPDATFAFIGFRLNVDALDEALAYDVSQYTGVQIQLETVSSVPTSVQVVLKTTGGGYFQYTVSPSNGGSALRFAPFSSMVPMDNSAEVLLDLTTVNEIQFSVVDPTGFAFAIHRVALY
ncbi:MAG: hypothetical protein ABUL60_13775 [Myxococcales bacterium]